MGDDDIAERGSGSPLGLKGEPSPAIDLSMPMSGEVVRGTIDLPDDPLAAPLHGPRLSRHLGPDLGPNLSPISAEDAQFERMLGPNGGDDRTDAAAGAALDPWPSLPSLPNLAIIWLWILIWLSILV
jgi:hypothetical protein